MEFIQAILSIRKNYWDIVVPLMYSEGDSPKCFLKQRLKYFGSLNPTSKAISEIFKLPCRRSKADFFNLIDVMKSFAESSTMAVSFLCNKLLLTHISAASFWTPNSGLLMFFSTILMVRCKNCSSTCVVVTSFGIGTRLCTNSFLNLLRFSIRLLLLALRWPNSKKTSLHIATASTQLVSQAGPTLCL